MVPTVTRMPRMQGLPAITSGLRVMRSSCCIAPVYDATRWTSSTSAGGLWDRLRRWFQILDLVAELRVHGLGSAERRFHRYVVPGSKFGLVGILTVLVTENGLSRFSGQFVYVFARPQP